MNRVILGILAVLPFPFFHLAGAAEKKDFRPFEGDYRGSALLVTNDSTSTGRTKVFFSVSPNAKSAVLTIVGYLTFQNTTFPVRQSIVLSQGKSDVSDVGFGIGTGTVFPGTGTYKVKSDKLVSFNAVSTKNNYPLSGTVKIKPAGKKRQTLLIESVLVGSANVYRFTFKVSGKISDSRD